MKSYCYYLMYGSDSHLNSEVSTLALLVAEKSTDGIATSSSCCLIFQCYCLATIEMYSLQLSGLFQKCNCASFQALDLLTPTDKSIPFVRMGLRLIYHKLICS